MAMSSSVQDRMLSMPRDVQVGPWRSNTVSLQQHGWDFYVSYRVHTLTYELALVNRQSGMQALSINNRIDVRVFEDMTSMNPQLLLPPIQCHAGQDLHLLPPDKYRGRRFHPVNMEPTYLSHLNAYPGDTRADVMAREQGIPLSLMIFRPDDRKWKDPAPDMIIKEQSVDDLLGLLKDQFATSDEEYYEHEQAGLITDKKEIQRHLHLVTVR